MRIIKTLVCYSLSISILLLSGDLIAAVEAHDFESNEQRALYLKLAQELRCPKCQNQNLADSNSTIAVDLRNQLARLVKQNQNEAEIKLYMVNRYGDFVLYDTAVQNTTYLLWFGPAIMLGLGLLIFFTIVMQRRKMTDKEDC